MENVKDIDGNSYKTAKIGDQIWMAENLKVTHYRNGDPIPNLTDNPHRTTGAYCNYDNDEDNVKTYGRLYNWYAVGDERGLAPKGWHVPTHEEWTILIDYLGGWKIAGGKMKSTGTIEGDDGLWESPNEGATNESSFNALPGGESFHSDGSYDGIGQLTPFWSSTEEDGSEAWFRLLGFSSSDVIKTKYWKNNGYSVRCIKD